MTALQRIEAAQGGSIPEAWRAPLALLAGSLAAILLLFAGDAADMARIWWTSSTFSHCLLIPPILAWLVWQRHGELAQLTPRAWTPGLGIVGIGAFGWLLGEAAGVSLARHFGLVLMLQGSTVAILGHAVARGLLFPLFYAFFLVPFGEELVPTLQTMTAELSMLLLGLFGVPAHIEGVFITTPTGYFEVAEACSGIKFLIAMVALGALAAHLCFRSWPRRVAFMAACIVVPILANGARAFGTILIAERSGVSFAESFDHVVYGWIFFALVIALVLGLSWRFFDRAADEPAFDSGALQSEADTMAPRRMSLVAALAIALSAAPLLWSAAVAGGGRAPELRLPEIAGWEASDAPMSYPWRARYMGADRLLEGRYRDGRGRTVDLAVAWYAGQREGRELVGFGQGGFDPESEWSWSSDLAPPPEGRAYRIVAPGSVTREVAQFHLVGDLVTGSNTRAKLETLRIRLLGGEQRAVGVIVSAEGADARAAIDSFLADAGSVARLVDRAAALPD